MRGGAREQGSMRMMIELIDYASFMTFRLGALRGYLALGRLRETNH